MLKQKLRDSDNDDSRTREAEKATPTRRSLNFDAEDTLSGTWATGGDEVGAARKVSSSSGDGERLYERQLRAENLRLEAECSRLHKSLEEAER